MASSSSAPTPVSVPIPTPAEAVPAGAYSDAPTPKRKYGTAGYTVYGGAVLFALFIIYVLSYGPVIASFVAYPPPPTASGVPASDWRLQAAGYIYAPITMACNVSPAAAEYCGKYALYCQRTLYPGSISAAPKYPMGANVPGKAGFVISPYAPSAGLVDVRGFPSGTEVRCPFSTKIFIVP